MYKLTQVCVTELGNEETPVVNDRVAQVVPPQDIPEAPLFRRNWRRVLFGESAKELSPWLLGYPPAWHLPVWLARRNSVWRSSFGLGGDLKKNLSCALMVVPQRGNVGDLCMTVRQKKKEKKEKGNYIHTLNFACHGNYFVRNCWLSTVNNFFVRSNNLCLHFFLLFFCFCFCTIPDPQLMNSPPHLC